MSERGSEITTRREREDFDETLQEEARCWLFYADQNPEVERGSGK